MEIRGEDYLVTSDIQRGSVEFSGTLRLRDSAEYQKISGMLGEVLEQAASGGLAAMVLDLRNLQFLNSSGINTISKFVITARKAESVGLRVLGNQAITWQKKSLSNLQKLWPKVAIELS